MCLVLITLRCSVPANKHGGLVLSPRKKCNVNLVTSASLRSGSWPLTTDLEEMAASPHGAVEMYMWNVTSSRRRRRSVSLDRALNRLPGSPDACSSRFLYRHLQHGRNYLETPTFEFSLFFLIGKRKQTRRLPQTTTTNKFVSKTDV